MMLVDDVGGDGGGDCRDGGCVDGVDYGYFSII